MRRLARVIGFAAGIGVSAVTAAGSGYYFGGPVPEGDVAPDPRRVRACIVALRSVPDEPVARAAQGLPREDAALMALCRSDRVIAVRVTEWACARPLIARGRHYRLALEQCRGGGS